MAALLISTEVYQNIICRQVKLLLWLNKKKKTLKKKSVTASPSQAVGSRSSIIYPVTFHSEKILHVQLKNTTQKSTIYAFLLFA